MLAKCNNEQKQLGRFMGLKDINNILLIDDNDADNYYNNLVISDASNSIPTQAFEFANDALDFIKDRHEDSADLILLDLHMPEMDGFAFLEAYEKLENKHRDNIVIVMLTGYLSPEETEKIKSFKSVKHFCSKPLSINTLEEIGEKYFCKLPEEG